MGEDVVATTSGEAGGTDTTDTSQTAVEANTARRTVIAIGLATLLVVGLISVTGWATIQRGWSLGQPWWYGLQLRYVATPIAAFTAAIVAITTAWWTVKSTRAISAAEHRRWETDRESENSRRATERQDAIERTLRDRFHELVKLLASDELRAREGAAYAVAALADDWAAHYANDSTKARAEQQVCIDVLISQLRDPLPPSNAGLVGNPDGAPRVQLIAFKHAIQNIIRSRLGRSEGIEVHPGVWSSFEFIFDGCIFHNLKLTGCVFDGESVSFRGAQFVGIARFSDARFAEDARFDGVLFAEDAWFDCVLFAKDAWFTNARFARDAWFAWPTGDFTGARFVEDAWFDGAHFAGEARFAGVEFSRDAHFAGDAWIDAGDVFFDSAHFARDVFFDSAHFAGDAHFNNAHFASVSSFSYATFAKSASFYDAHFTESRESLENEHSDEGPFLLFGAHFDVAPDDFPKCEVCDELCDGYEPRWGPA
jgi:hypothetical protein